MWHPQAADTQTNTIKSQEWNFGSLNSQVFTTNNYDVNYVQLLVFYVNIYTYIYMLITKWYVHSEYLFIHGIPEAILKMSATGNDADGCWTRL